MEPVLVSLAWKSTLVLVCAGLLALATTKRSAAERHTLWAVAILALLLLPFTELSLPGRVAVAVVPTEVTETLQQPVEAITHAARPDVGWVWVAGCLAVLAYYLTGYATLYWRLRNAARAPFAVERARVVEADVALPLTFGILEPVIVMPRTAREWNPDRLRVVLLHESAHVQRRDALTQLLAQLATALFWFQPLVWVAANRMKHEREQACDDAVLNSGCEGTVYASHLLGIAASAPRGALAMAQRSTLETRIRAALDHNLSRKLPSRRVYASLVTAMVVGLVVTAGIRATAQSGNARLEGTVLDPSGAAVPDSEVAVISEDRSRKEITRTGGDGRYEFASLPAGRYAVEVRARGFALLSTPAPLTLEAGKSLMLPLSLNMGRVQDTITITGRGPKPPEPPSSAAPQRVRVGGNVQATKILEMTKPVYPDDLQQSGVDGTVLLEGVIGTDGRLLSLRSLNSLVHPGLTKSAIEAVSQWRYRPTLLNGLPVEVVTTITVHFRLTAN